MVYSVLKEPVIPVLLPDGTKTQAGIEEVLLHAHEIRDIEGDTPLDRYALLRLLIALAMDMLHPKDSFARRDLLEMGQFDPTIIRDYIELCEKDGPRFDLFDPDHPFLQSRYEESLDVKAEKPVAAIIHSLPSGNNHVFLDHRAANTHAVTYARAFQALVSSYVFCVSGTAGPSSVNNTPPIYAVMLGETLYETIVVNMISESEAMPLSYGTGLVPWRKVWKVIPKGKVADVTLLEGLTWMPRRITLVPEEGKVKRVFCQAGLDFKGNERWNDPHVPKFKKEDGTYGTVKPELDKSLWRDAGTLMYDHDGKKIRQPLTMRCITNVIDEEDLPIWLNVRGTGLITNQAAYTGWMEETLSIPSSLLHDQDKAECFREDAGFLETMQLQIYKSVQRNVDKLRAGSDGKEHEISSQCRQYFLQGAHDLLFGRAMNEINKKIPGKEHSEHFCDAVKKLIQETIRGILRASGSDVHSMMGQMEAEKYIWISFNKLMEERMKNYAGT